MGNGRLLFQGFLSSGNIFIVKPTKKVVERINSLYSLLQFLRAVHKYKDSREQFERRTHKRLIDITNSSPKTVEALMALELPAGVEIEIKL